jgi:hypothetical protein
MSKLGLARLCLVALALTAVEGSLAAAASGAQWLVGKEAFNGMESIGVTVVRALGGVSPITFHARTFSVPEAVVGCGTMSMKEGQIFGGNKGKVQSISFKQCTMIQPEGCKVNEEINTPPLTMEAVTLKTESESVYLTLVPKVGQEFLNFTVTACFGAEKYVLIGGAACSFFRAELIAVTKLCNFDENSLNTVKSFGRSAELRATVGFSLTGAKQGQLWGVDP